MNFMEEKILEAITKEREYEKLTEELICQALEALERKEYIVAQGIAMQTQYKAITIDQKMSVILIHDMAVKKDK
ncbi:MAG: hypothetical protein ACRCTZ_01965 [Sarcina sp.]